MVRKSVGCEQIPFIHLHINETAPSFSVKEFNRPRVLTTKQPNTRNSELMYELKGEHGIEVGSKAAVNI